MSVISGLKNADNAYSSLSSSTRPSSSSSSGSNSGLAVSILSHPTRIAIDYRNGDVYVADTGNNRVVRAALNGTVLQVIGGLCRPMGLSLDTQLGGGPRGTLFIANAGSDQILRYDLTSGLMSNVYVAPIGEGSHSLSLRGRFLIFDH
jgi:DNA-binding beta-propeller fold protein YncE